MTAVTYAEDALNEHGKPEKVLHVSEYDWMILKPILSEGLKTYKKAARQAITKKLKEYNDKPDMRKEVELSHLGVHSNRIDELKNIFT